MMWRRLILFLLVTALGLYSCGNTESFRITVFDNDTDQIGCEKEDTAP